MKKKTLLAALLSVGLLLTGCGTTQAIDRNEMTDEQWVKDIDYIVKSVNKNHDNPYHTITEEEWMKEVEQLKENLPTLSPVQTSLRMNQLVSMLHDEYTVTDYSTLVGETREDMIVFPLTFDWFENQLYVIQTDEEAKSIVGAKLVAINGQDVKKIIEDINTLIPHESVEWAKVNNRILITFPEVLRYFDISKNEEATFTFEKEDKTVEEITLKGKKYKDIQFVADASEAYRESVTQKLPEDAYGTYWYTYVPESKTFYFQYNQGVFKDDMKSNSSVSLPKFKEFSNQLVEEVKKYDIQKFVVDLRRNSSGNPERMNAIIKALKEETSVFSDAKVYGVIGYNTFGVGVTDAIALKENANATLVGEASGGHTTGYNSPVVSRLPNSQIVLQVATDKVEIPGYEGTLKPDVEINQTFSQYQKGIDTVFEYITK